MINKRHTRILDALEIAAQDTGLVRHRGFRFLPHTGAYEAVFHVVQATDKPNAQKPSVVITCTIQDILQFPPGIQKIQTIVKCQERVGLVISSESSLVRDIHGLLQGCGATI